MISFKRTILLGLSLILVSGLLVAATSATVCWKQDAKCGLTLVLSEYNGQPTTFCLIGKRVVEITASAKCKGKIKGPAGPVNIYRCEILSDGFQFSGSGITHYVGLSKGDWGDVLDGACDNVTYSTDI